jgi:hypothetical protein
MKVFSWKDNRAIETNDRRIRHYGAALAFVFNSKLERIDAVLLTMVGLEYMPVAHQAQVVIVPADTLTYEREI